MGFFKKIFGGGLGGLFGGLLGGVSKAPNVAEEQAKLKAAADAAARSERDKAAATQANKENLYAADAAQTSARANFMAGITQDTEENRRKFLKKV
jgi:Flp pilus assembly protein TadG